MTQPCGWEIDPGCCTGWDDFSTELKAAATAWAVDQLWMFTGRRYSSCPVTVRPCFSQFRPRSYETFGVWMDNGANLGWSWWPYLDGVGNWRNCGCPAAFCGCGPTCEVWLTPPVQEVTEILIDGVELATGWRVEDRQWLVRQDGGCWPEQSMDDPAPGGFQVTYTLGYPPPASAARMVGMLACEYAKFCTGQPCALSPEVTSITRDGVSFELVPAGKRDDVPTGIQIVDQWIRALNPSRLRSAPQVDTPDLFPSRVVTQSV